MKAVFKAPGGFEWFLDELAGYDQCYRINDRWWQALARLAEHENFEEGFTHTEDMAAALREHGAARRAAELASTASKGA